MVKKNYDLRPFPNDIQNTGEIFRDVEFSLTISIYF